MRTLMVTMKEKNLKTLVVVIKNKKCLVFRFTSHVFFYKDSEQVLNETYDMEIGECDFEIENEA